MDAVTAVVNPSLEEQRLHLQSSIDTTLALIVETVRDTITPRVLKEIGGRETYLHSNWQTNIPPLFNYIMATCGLADSINA